MHKTRTTNQKKRDQPNSANPEKQDAYNTLVYIDGNDDFITGQSVAMESVKASPLLQAILGGQPNRIGSPELRIHIGDQLGIQILKRIGVTLRAIAIGAIAKATFHLKIIPPRKRRVFPRSIQGAAKGLWNWGPCMKSLAVMVVQISSHICKSMKKK